MIEGAEVAETVEYDDTVNKKELQSQIMERKELWENKILHGQFVGEISEVTETWN